MTLGLSLVDADGGAKRSFVVEKTVAVTLTPNFVDHSNKPYLASAIGFDSCHVELFKPGGPSNGRGSEAQKRVREEDRPFRIRALQRCSSPRAGGWIDTFPREWRL
jgi:hypothetical protein